MNKPLLLPLILGILLQGCGLIAIIPSAKRDTVPQNVRLPGGVILTSTGAVNINVFLLVDHKDFFPSGFRIEAPGKTIYIDPIAVNDPKPADYIFITHSHGDHLSLPDIKKLSDKKTLIICPKTAAAQISGFSVKEVKPGDRLMLNGIKCEAVASYNIKTGALGMVAHPASDMNVGYIITINGTRIYHAGDTDFIPEMKEIKDITIALVPIDGGSLTMSTEEAAGFINTLRPKIAVPMHYLMGTNNTEIFKNLVNKDIQVKIMQKEGL